MSNESKNVRTRRLIEDWLPIAELSEECVRERRSMTALPPTYYLHVWFARRPLIASRAAILASLLEPNQSTGFLREIGILGDPIATKKRIELAKRNIDSESGEREDLGADPYGYPRAFQYFPGPLLSGKTVLDPTAGGGSIPFEAARLGANVIASDLNPVAALILKATVEFPIVFGAEVLDRFESLSDRFTRLAEERLKDLFPAEDASVVSVDGYVWARTVTCPRCGGTVPLSPNWKLSTNGVGVQLIPDLHTRTIKFKIVHGAEHHSKGTVKDGVGECPFAECQQSNPTIESEEIRRQAHDGKMGHQLYAVVLKRQIEVPTKNGRARKKNVRAFRAPQESDDVQSLIKRKLAEKLPEWQARNILPDEHFPADSNDTRPIQFGAPLWRDLFSPRQLFGHCTSVEVFHDLVDELSGGNGQVPDLDRAALAYLAITIDKLIDWNSRQCTWEVGKDRMAHTFHMHGFPVMWSNAEMAPAVTGSGYAWAISQTKKALKELIQLSSGTKIGGSGTLFSTPRTRPNIQVLNQSADSLQLPDQCVDAVVMDPPYYDNVMYAELADFFYVWLKRTAGLLYPDLFSSYLTDKDREAVASPAKFAGQKGGAKNLAGRDYQERMAAIFAEQRRVLRVNGIMTVMFTHKAKGAWDALATGLIEAGFVITASWPVHTESEASLHIREKAAAKSTIFLVCRVRNADANRDEPRYWEEVEPLVAAKVREKVKSFQDSGLGGVDLYLACFGPALEVFSNEWPLTRGRARAESFTQARRRKKQAELFQEEEDPYAVRPEDALEAARREVKNWRLSQLATVSRQHHLDPLTEWYMLAWDTFRAAKFDADEALKLARVIGLDFDQQVRNVVCDLKTDQVTLWDSRTRHEKGKLGHVGDEVMLDTLHWAALTVRDQNTGAAKSMLERANLIDDPTLKTALEAMLKVLPQRAMGSALAGFAADFEALEKLRHLAFEGDVPAPPEQLGLELGGDGGEEDE